MSTPKKPVMFDELSSNEIAEAAKAGAAVILPLGSIEAHSSHLPLCTDSIQAEYIAVEVAKKTGSVVAPPVRFGICNATRNFPGTLTVQFDTLYALVHDLLSELVRSGFRRIMLISGHAGNSHMVALRLASQDIVVANEDKGVRIMVLSDFDYADELIPEYAAEGDGHAGTIETSRVMAIRPDLIKGPGKADAWRMPRFEVIAHPELCIPSAVHGDPTAASKEKGEKINRYIIEKVAELLEELKR